MKKSKNNSTGGIKEIAKRANVAIATVDRVIHNRKGVSKKTREKIEAIIKELNYQPNILARRLASKKIYHFAILLPKVSEETNFWEAPLQGIEQAEAEISQYGVKILKYFFDLKSKASFNEQAEIILKEKVDGLLVAPSFIEESIKLITACKEQNIPYVFINSDIAGQENLCYFGPHLFQSGYLAAHLMKYSVVDKARILVVNISKELDNQDHLLRIEEGFRAYFKEKQRNNEIIKIDIRQTDYSSIEKNVSHVFEQYQDIKAIFATNSRISSVASFVEKAGIKDTILVGFDCIEENLKYLKKGIIDFLICQRPEVQGYQGIMALYQMLILKVPVEKINYMPNDIITKENFLFYHN